MTEEKIDQIMETVCDLCKWPSEYKDPDDLWNRKCDSCPVAEALNRLKEEGE